MEANHHFNDPTNSIQVQNPNTHWPGGWGGTQRQSWCNGEMKNLSPNQTVITGGNSYLVIEGPKSFSEL